MEIGKIYNIQPYGTEALSTLRIEMGHVAGQELDGRTIPADLSLDGDQKRTLGKILNQEAFTQQKDKK